MCCPWDDFFDSVILYFEQRFCFKIYVPYEIISDFHFYVCGFSLQLMTVYCKRPFDTVNF